MGGGDEAVTRVRATTSLPTIIPPPRSAAESWYAAASPGPLSLVSSFFSHNYPDSSADDDCRTTFSQLPAGSMASPGAAAGAGRTAGSSEEGGPDVKPHRPSSLRLASFPVFTVSGLLNSPRLYSPGQGALEMLHQQLPAQVTAQAVPSQSCMHVQSEYQLSFIEVTKVESKTHNPNVITDGKVHHQGPTITSDPNSHTISDKTSHPPVAANYKPVDDGYNWRKYGQKHVKGNEYPRSYYRCTRLKCPVRKKVGRSFDGQVTEIIYRGQHNHELPQPNRCTRDGSDLSDNLASQAKPEIGLQGQKAGNGSDEIIPGDGEDQESTQEETEQLAGPTDSEGDDEEPYAKRRSIEGRTSEPASVYKTVTDSRIIVQTRSEVDILDDGYKWRKYGQKAVKGNLNPRSYYKCTSAGCNVRKHIERASTDPKAVITTYEGKHNHDVPALKISSHNTASGPPQ